MRTICASSSFLLCFCKVIGGLLLAWSPRPAHAGAACAPGLRNAISTTSGCVQGALSEDGTRESFLGIPYAKAPVGALRFRLPQPHENWSAPFRADRLGPPCSQPLRPSNPATPFVVSIPSAEDCLTLNIWRPKDARNLPVLFFIHGGGATTGTSALPVYSGSPDLARDAVLVTLNYRLGANGVLAHPALAAENADGASGNWGLWDILLALRWVNDNAAALGGDRRKIMIFGESSGGGDVLVLLASPRARGLFTSAIAQSAPYLNRGTFPSLKGPDPGSGEQLGLVFAKKLGCDATPPGDPKTAECLRSKPADELVQAWQSLKLDGSPRYVDGAILPDKPNALFQNGSFNRVPVVMGMMSEEMGAFGATGNRIVKSWSELDKKIREDGAKLGVTDLERLAGLYHDEAGYGTPGVALDHFRYDTYYLCPAYSFLRVVGQRRNVTALGYYMTHAPSFESRGPVHGRELFFVFGSEPFRSRFSDAERPFAAAIQRAWSSVAAGAPFVEGLGRWPAFGKGTFVQLDTPIKIARGLRARECEFFDSQGVYFPPPSPR